MQEFIVNYKYRGLDGDTLQSTRPDLHDGTEDLAKLLAKLLSQCWPRAFIERVEISQ